VYFDFQGDYTIFKIEINGQKIESQPGREGYYDFMVKTKDNDKYRNFIDIVDTKLHQLRDDLNAE
jgi:hypothetical protein